MAYSDLSLETVFQRFDIQTAQVPELFSTIEALEVSPYLIQYLEKNTIRTIAMGTEKARSEFLIAPVLIEVVDRFPRKISIFSGVEFSPSPEQDLKGVCDFLISLSSEQMVVREPVIAVVEAKNDNVKNGFSQCISEMVASQIFNQRAGKPLKTVYGVSTTGTSWFFMHLVEKTIYTDFLEYSISDPGKIIGILLKMLHDADKELNGLTAKDQERFQ